MSAIDVVSPANEDGTTATVLRWLKKVGDPVALHEPLLELETDKVTVEVASPATGFLREILAQERERLEAGAILGRIDLAGDVAQPPAKASKVPAAQLPSSAPSAHRLSPAVRRIAAEKGIDLETIAGSGRDGRITARDLESKPPTARRIPHSAMRRRIAERMSESVATAPHVTSLFEADLTRALAHRDANAADFAQRGAKLTLTAYFVSAAVQALRAVPEVNASYHEDALELHPSCNVGIGTALQGEGLVVPVIRAAETLDLFGIATELQRLTNAARAGSLTAEMLRGGTFSISNHGVSGSLLAAPIVIVQPQIAILGIGKLTRRAVVVGEGATEGIAIKPMCYVTLTIDHRALDGFQANVFLSVLVRALEQWPHRAQ